MPEGREAWLTVRALLAADEPWAPPGTRSPSGSCPSRAGAPRYRPPARAPHRDGRPHRARPGRVRRCDGPPRAARVARARRTAPRRLARADRQRRRHPRAGAARRRVAGGGLDRMVERVLGVELDGDRVVVRVRVAAAGTDRALLASFTWTADGDGLALRASRSSRRASGRSRCRGSAPGMALPARAGGSSGSGSARARRTPTRAPAVRVGRFAAAVDDLQTPYVMPQENGNRAAGPLGRAHRRRRRAACASRAARTSS